MEVEEQHEGEGGVGRWGSNREVEDKDGGGG